jgi:hypothetical protein
MNIEQRFFIKFALENGRKPIEIRNCLKSNYGEEVLSQTHVFFWVNELKHGRKNLHDSPKPGRIPSAIE